MHIEDDSKVVVPPHFEAVTYSFLFQIQNPLVRYPILLTAELRAALLWFRQPLTSPFHKPILIGLSPSPTL